MKGIKYILIGIFFGILLTKSQVISWFRIHDMFLFKDLHVVLVILSAIFIGAISYLIVKAFGIKTIHGKEIEIEKKPYNKGIIFGGILFGVGWAITGACPGPIFAQIGTGAYPAIITLLGAIVGTYIYSYLKPKLPH